MSTDPWGITDGYHDAAGGWHETSAATRAALRAAMGVDETSSPSAPPVRVVREGMADALAAPGSVASRRDAPTRPR